MSIYISAISNISSNLYYVTAFETYLENESDEIFNPDAKFDIKIKTTGTLLPTTCLPAPVMKQLSSSNIPGYPYSTDIPDGSLIVSGTELAADNVDFYFNPDTRELCDIHGGEYTVVNGSHIIRLIEDQLKEYFNDLVETE